MSDPNLSTMSSSSATFSIEDWISFDQYEDDEPDQTKTTTKPASTARQVKKPWKRPSSSELDFTGVLKDHHIQDLNAQFGATVVCPGFTSQYGVLTDKAGRFFIPGASAGIWHTRRKLQAMAKKSEEDPRYNWWSEHVIEREISFITISDVLQGIKKERWTPYYRAYKHAALDRKMLEAKDKKV